MQKNFCYVPKAQKAQKGAQKRAVELKKGTFPLNYKLYLVLLHIWHTKSHSGSGSGFMSKFFFLHNFVNSAHTEMYDTSNESCAQGLYFFSTPKSFELFMGTL